MKSNLDSNLIFKNTSFSNFSVQILNAVNSRVHIDSSEFKDINYYIAIDRLFQMNKAELSIENSLF